MKYLRNEDGFTLIETLIAATVLAIGILTYVGMQITSIRGHATSMSITGKSNWAADRVEKLLYRPYDELVALDVDGDGTNQDPLQIGQDKDDENFGLHHDTIDTADGNAVSPDSDNTYRIFWNVAVDKPVVNTVTVNVIVTSKKQNLTDKTEFVYIKAKEI